MIRVAMCDDEMNIRSYLASLVRKQAVDCEIAGYGSADAFLAAVAAGEEYDLLFLDIDFGGADIVSATDIVSGEPAGESFASDEPGEPGSSGASGEPGTSGRSVAAGRCSSSFYMDGIALARRLRGMNLYRQPLIVFVTGYDSYVYEAFDVEAFQYLIKPIDEVRFAELFQRAVRRIAAGAERRQTQTASEPKPQSEPVAAEAEQRRRSLVIQQAGVRKVVPWDSIYYAESQGHKILLHLKDGILESYGKIGELEQSLPEQFCRIHKGYLINLAYVEEYTRTAVTLTNGEQLLISKYKYDAFAKAHLRYLQ